MAVVVRRFDPTGEVLARWEVLARDEDGAPAFLSLPAAMEAALGPPTDAELHVGDLIAVVPAEAAAFPEEHARALYVVTPDGVKKAPETPYDLGASWLSAWGHSAHKMIEASSEVDDRRVVMAVSDCAETVLPITPAGDGRPRQAIATARSWCIGTSSMDDARNFNSVFMDDDAGTYASSYVYVYGSAAHAAARAAGSALVTVYYANSARTTIEATADAARRFAGTTRESTDRALAPLVERWIPLPVVLLSRLGYPDAIPFDPSQVTMATRENGRRSMALRANDRELKAPMAVVVRRFDPTGESLASWEVLARDADGAPAFLSIPAAKKAALQPPADADLHVGDLIAVVPAEAAAFPEKYAKALYVLTPDGVKEAPKPPEELGGPWLSVWGQRAVQMLASSKYVDRLRLSMAAFDCAETVLHLVPTEDDRPRKAIDAARAWRLGRASYMDAKNAASNAADNHGTTNRNAYSAASSAAFSAIVNANEAAQEASDAAWYAYKASGDGARLASLVERWIPLPVVLLSNLGYYDAIPFDPSQVTLATRENGRAMTRSNGKEERDFAHWFQAYKHGRVKALDGDHWRFESHLAPDGQLIHNGQPYVRLDMVRAQARRSITDAVHRRYTEGERRGEPVATGGVYELFEQRGSGPWRSIERMALVPREIDGRHTLAWVHDADGYLLRALREVAALRRSSRSGSLPRMPRAGESLADTAVPSRRPAPAPLRVEDHRPEALQLRIHELARRYQAAVVEAVRDWRLPVTDLGSVEDVRRHVPALLPDPNTADASIPEDEDRARRLAALQVGAWLRAKGPAEELRRIKASGEEVFRANGRGWRLSEIRNAVSGTYFGSSYLADRVFGDNSERWGPYEGALGIYLVYKYLGDYTVVRFDGGRRELSYAGEAFEKKELAIWCAKNLAGESLPRLATALKEIGAKNPKALAEEMVSSLKSIIVEDVQRGRAEMYVNHWKHPMFHYARPKEGTEELAFYVDTERYWDRLPFKVRMDLDNAGAYRRNGRLAVLAVAAQEIDKWLATDGLLKALKKIQATEGEAFRFNGRREHPR